MLKTTLITTALALVATLLAPPLPARSAQQLPGCLVIAHRGASAYLPEHTLAGYRLAVELGADYIEPDLVLTRDGVLIARHENELGLTTDIAEREKFAERSSERQFRGKSMAGWFSEDFTLAEIRSLRARERWPELRRDSAARDGDYPIPTFAEVLALVRELEAETGRRIGLYPELKTPDYFRERGFDPESTLIEMLADAGYDSADDPVFIQSFDPAALQRLAPRTELKLVQLLWRTPDMPATGAVELDEIARYAQGVGVEKHGFIIPLDAQDRLDIDRSSDFVGLAHARGLLVHAYTFRAQNRFLPSNLRSDRPENRAPADRGDIDAEIQAFLDAGIDGLFVDEPDIGRAACDRHRGS
jgi:glycerophosphoryl diester phosphodiesterase